MSEHEDREAQICCDLLVDFFRKHVAAGRSPEALALWMVILGSRELENIRGAGAASAALEHQAATLRQRPTDPGMPAPSTPVH